MKSKLVFGLIVLLVLIILIAGLKSVLSGPSDVNLPSLYGVLSEQQELINLTTIGGQQSVSQRYLNFSFTTLGSVTTDQTNLTTLLTANHYTINTTNLVLQPSLDSALNQAAQQSNFDPTYGPMMQAQLNKYQQLLSQAYSLNKSNVVRSYLSADYTNTKMLIKMLSSSSG